MSSLSQMINGVRLNYTQHRNPIPNSQFPLNFHFNINHQILDIRGIENLLFPYSFPSLQFQIHPRLLANRVLLSHQILGFLCFNLEISDEDREYLADTIAFSFPSQLPLSQVDVFVDIIRTEFRETNRMMIGGGFVPDNIVIEDRVVDGVMIFDDAINGVIEKGRFEFVDESDEECAICFEKYMRGITAVKMASCSHIFHEKCILKWFERKNNCPLCRTIAY